MANPILYIITERGYDYNDENNYYTDSEYITEYTYYTSKEKAEKAKNRLIINTFFNILNVLCDEHFNEYSDVDKDNFLKTLLSEKIITVDQQKELNAGENDLYDILSGKKLTDYQILFVYNLFDSDFYTIKQISG